MATKVANGVSTLTVNALTTSAIQINLTAGSGAQFPTLNAATNDRVWVTLTSGTGTPANEVVECTSISGDTLTVVRAQDNTVAQAWPAGTIVEIRNPAALFNDKVDVAAAVGLMGRNRIINGNMVIAQRSASFTTTGTNYGGPDRWQFGTVGAGGQLTQASSSFTYGGRSILCATQTVNTSATSLTGTNGFLGFKQAIEGFNCYDLIGQQLAVSFIFSASVAGTYSMAINDISNTHSYVTTFNVASANTPTYYSFTIPAVPSAFGATASATTGMYLYVGFLNNGTYATSTLGSWQSGQFICGNSIAQWGTSGSTISIAQVQLELGPQPTPFEIEPAGVTLAKCQRYFQICPSATRLWGSVVTSTQLVFNYYPPTFMRISPSVALLATSGTCMESLPFQAGVGGTFSLTATHANSSGPFDIEIGYSGVSPALTVGAVATWTAGVTFSAEF
ncbi:hypothetical protein [Paraburkholderia unamae]|uniref:Uncharacterized protein n=1 Tax=Paraburkholderia unamae TaxID=219649 RepID=A0ACC6RH14_9BURK